MTFDYLCDWLKGLARGVDWQAAGFRQKRKLKSCPVCNHTFQGWNYKAKHPPRDQNRLQCVRTCTHALTCCFSTRKTHSIFSPLDECRRKMRPFKWIDYSSTQPKFICQKASSHIESMWGRDGERYVLSLSVISPSLCELPSILSSPSNRCLHLPIVVLCVISNPSK